MSTRVLLLAVTALLLAPPVSAQVTFKSGVDLVRFDVRVVDQTGRPITDLKPEEIIIEEDGKRLPIMMFQRVTEPADESFQEEAIRAVTAQVSSNEAFPRGHLYILIFDQEHITPGNEQRARMAAEEFIRTRVRPSDRLALYAVPGPGPQIGFTADKMRALSQLPSIRGMHQRTVSTPFGTMALYEAHRLVQGDVKLLADVLERMQSQASGDAIAADGGTGRLVPGAGEDPSVTQRLLIENARVVVQQSDGASRQFLQRLSDVIRQFKDIEGRKTVVLFSEGFFQDNLSRELEEVAAAAAQSYCVFYTFDLNQRTGGVEEAQMPTTVRATEIQSRIAPLSTLAVETDGMMIVDAVNRSGEALDRIADQTQDYYLLGFTPSEQALANRGKYRRVNVKVTRPGARVSSRTGYAVSPEQTPTDRKRAINSVLGAPFAQQGLKLDYTTYVMKGSEAGQHRVILSLNADLPVRSNPGDAADIVFVARDMQDGRIVANAADTVPLPANPRPGSSLGTGTWRAQFNLPPGSYMMRMVVREPGGLVGSADRRIDVRPLSGPDVTTSDLVIGSALGGLPVRPRAYSEDGLTGILEAYGRSTLQLEGLSGRLELRRVEGGDPVSNVAAELRDVEQDAGGGASRKVTFVLPLTDVPSGNYIAHAIISARGEVVAERTRQVEVLAGAAPPMPNNAARPVVAPIEIARGDLGRRYIAALADRAKGRPYAGAAKQAVEGRWEEVHLAMQAAAGQTSPDAEALRGFAAFVREDYKVAAAALQRSLDAEQNALTAFFLGWAHDGAGDERAAISSWRVAAHLDPKLVSAHLALADGYLKISERALAVQALRAGLTALPDSPELQSRLEQLEAIR